MFGEKIVCSAIIKDDKQEKTDLLCDQAQVMMQDCHWIGGVLELLPLWLGFRRALYPSFPWNAFLLDAS